MENGDTLFFSDLALLAAGVRCLRHWFSITFIPEASRSFTPSDPVKSFVAPDRAALAACEIIGRHLYYEVPFHKLGHLGRRFP